MDGSTTRSDSGSFGSDRPGANKADAGGGGTRLPGLAGTESEKQLTQRELAALKTIKRNVDTTKYAGWLLGASGTWILLSRRKPPPRMLPKLGWSVVGGLGGSFLTMPIGILLSRGALKDVEDPQHLRRVLAGAIEEQRQGKRPQVGVAPPKGLNGETDFDSQSQPQPQQQQEWGGEPAAQNYGSGYDNGFAAADTFSAYSPTQASPNSRRNGNASRSAPSESSSDASPPDGTGSGTRWAQLRGERGVEPSKWERIRQDNARSAYSRTASSRAEQSNSEDSASHASSSNASAPPPPQQQQKQQQQSGAPSRASRPNARGRDEPVMTLSGAEDDPRWSSPATFSSQSSGWGNDEFLDDPAAGSNERRNGGARRGYGILSVLEDGASGVKTDVGYQLESDAPIQVVKGSLLAALVGGVGGSIYGVLRGRQGAGTVLGTRMAFSSFAFAFPFFAVREYVMSPVLNRTSSGPDPANRHMRLRTVTQNRHTHNLLASGLAGAVVGAGAAAFTRGPAAIHKGIVTFGVACTGLQLAGNEARTVRDALIRPGPRAVPVSERFSTPSNSSDAAVSVSQAAAPLIDIEPKQQTAEKDGEQMAKSGWFSKVKNVMPIRSVSDEEYEAKLKERLTNVNQRMADVETEIREIEALLQQQEKKQEDARG